MRLTRVRGVPLASEALSFAAPQIKPRFNLPGSPNETGPQEYSYFAQKPSSQALAILRASHRRLLGWFRVGTRRRWSSFAGGVATGHGLSSDDHDDADVDVDPTAGWQGVQCGGW